MYKWDAEDYQKNSFSQQKWARELISKLELKGNENILDIGCGDGKISAEIASILKDGQVLGIDNSKEMIELARKDFPATQFSNLKFEIKDAKELDFKSQFDIVFSNAALHWITDHLVVLKGIKRSLKHSGKILLQMGGKGNAADILDIVHSMMNTGKWKKYFEGFNFQYGFYGTDEYKKWLKEAGLSVIRVELIPKDMIQPGKEELKAWIRTTWLPYTQKVPIKHRDEFIGELAGKYIEKYPQDTKGQIHINMVRLEVEAKKKVI